MWLFCGVYALVMGGVLFGDTYHNYFTMVLLLYTLAALGLMLLAYRALVRCGQWLRRRYAYILSAFAVVYFLLVTVIGFALRFTPTFDMDAIYGGAVQWLQEGSFSDYYDYFGYFPNNLGGLVVLHAVFALASLFGITDFFAVGIVFNALLITAAVVLLSLVCTKLAGTTAGSMALILFTMQLPFWVMGAAFYTDSISLPFPILFYYLYLCYKEQTELKKMAAHLIGMALALAVGCLIKFTVIIVLIAVLMEVLLRLKWKDAARIAGAAVLVVALVFGEMNAHLYRYHLDKARCDELKTPYLHWVMMGMRNNGAYNPEDYEYTRSTPAPLRNAACLERIRQRAAELKFSGLTQLFFRKAAVCLGDGTFAVSDFLDDTPAQHHWLHDHVLYGSEHYTQYKHMTTGVLLALYALMILGALPRGGPDLQATDAGTLAPHMAVLGILAFLLLWETSGRYVTNFIPLFDVCAVLGLVRLIGPPGTSGQTAPKSARARRRSHPR